MKVWIFSTIISVIAVSSIIDEWNLIHFSKTEEELRRCIETQTDLPRVLNETVKNTEVASYIIERLANLTHELTLPVENIQAIAINSVTILNYMKSKLSKYQGKRVKRSIMRALHKCSGPERVRNMPQTGYHDLPHFVQDVPELATFFNLMLVPSGFYLRDHHSLFFIYAIAEKALSLLESALGKLNNDLHELDMELISMWNRRARLFFDDNKIHRYIINNYFDNHPKPYTPYDPSWFTQRRFVPYIVRDPLNQSIKYYETEKYYFLEVLFLGLEIAESGLIDLNNVHNTSLTYRDIPEYHLNKRWRTRAAFRQYLDTRQMTELSYDFAKSSPIFSSLVQSLQDGDRIDGLHLALMFFLRIKSQRAETKTTTTRPTVPTLVLRASPDFSLELPSTSSELFGSCLPHWSRFKRDLSSETHQSIEDYLFDDNPLYMIFTFNTSGIDTLNKDLYLTLKEEHKRSSRNNMSFVNFVQDELKNASSTASKILNQACDKYYSDNGNYDKDFNVNGDNQVQFSTSKSWIFSCMKRHRLFHCNESYENKGMVNKIAVSAAKIFSSTIKTITNIHEDAENLINVLKYSYREIPVEYLIQPTIEAALYCSNGKIISTFECPRYVYEYMAQIMLAFFDKSLNYDENVKQRSQELVDYSYEI